jgi:hypothetical protein
MLSTSASARSRPVSASADRPLTWVPSNVVLSSASEKPSNEASGEQGAPFSQAVVVLPALAAGAAASRAAAVAAAVSRWRLRNFKVPPGHTDVPDRSKRIDRVRASPGQANGR